MALKNRVKKIEEKQNPVLKELYLICPGLRYVDDWPHSKKEIQIRLKKEIYRGFGIVTNTNLAERLEAAFRRIEKESKK